MKPDVTKWRNADEYGFVHEAPADVIAWEFLRRNRAYQADFLSSERDDLHSRWGLQFRGTAR